MLGIVKDIYKFWDETEWPYLSIRTFLISCHQHLSGVLKPCNYSCQHLRPGSVSLSRWEGAAVMLDLNVLLFRRGEAALSRESQFYRGQGRYI